MIKSFKCKETARLFYGNFCRKLPLAIQRVALRKLKILDAATMLETLRIPPGNRLEALKHDRVGQYSLRINDHGEFVLFGKRATRLTLKLLIIIEDIMYAKTKFSSYSSG